MKRFIKITICIFTDIVRAIGYFVENNLRNFAKLFNFILPYLMYLIGQKVYDERKYISFGGEILIPLVVFLLIYYINSYANKIGKGTTVPTPNKRFTEIDDDGEVSIENSRLQELILYIADLEDWFERKGML